MGCSLAWLLQCLSGFSADASLAASAPLASAAQLLLSAGLVTSAARASSWQAAAVRAGLASLTLLDFRPTAERQLGDLRGALAASPAAAKRWALLVRAKVLGELAGLSVAIRAPCVGACIVLLAHLLFWKFDAAAARVDASGEPAPLPPNLARVIATADAAVFACAALGAFGPTPLARSAGAALFATSAAAVAAEQVPKALARRRTSSEPTMRVTSPRVPPRPRGTPAPRMAMVEPVPTTTTTPESRAAPDDRSDSDDDHHRIWSECWWPLAFAAHTTRTEPYAVTLLGAPLVLWWDGKEGAWRCTVDRCSHRLAPLSEGRLTDDGCIECPYHGWAFDGGGACTRIPQQPEGASFRARSVVRVAVLARPHLATISSSDCI